MKKLTIRIDKQGKVEIEASGYAGTSCEAATQAFRDLLGKTEQVDLKPEYSQEEHTEKEWN